MLLCITAGEGGHEYIHCPTEGHIQNTIMCYLNPQCPDKYIYIHTVVSDEDITAVRDSVINFMYHQFHQHQETFGKYFGANQMISIQKNLSSLSRQEIKVHTHQT